MFNFAVIDGTRDFFSGEFPKLFIKESLTVYFFFQLSDSLILRLQKKSQFVFSINIAKSLEILTSMYKC